MSALKSWPTTTGASAGAPSDLTSTAADAPARGAAVPLAEAPGAAGGDSATDGSAPSLEEGVAIANGLGRWRAWTTGRVVGQTCGWSERVNDCSRPAGHVVSLAKRSGLRVHEFMPGTRTPKLHCCCDPSSRSALPKTHALPTLPITKCIYYFVRAHCACGQVSQLTKLLNKKHNNCMDRSSGRHARRCQQHAVEQVADGPAGRHDHARSGNRARVVARGRWPVNLARAATPPPPARFAARCVGSPPHPLVCACA